MNEPILKVKGLKKYFPVTAGVFRKEVAQIKAVDGIDFTVPERKVIAIVGESGSGKSTAARAAIRLIEPTAGEITFLDQNLRALNKYELRNIRKEAQMVFQDPNSSLNPRQTVGESIGEALLYHKKVKTKQEARKKVAEVMHLIGLSPEYMDRYPHQFSGGQQQRICIGRAIALNPKLIICDEAVSALDVSVQAQILNLLENLQAQMGLSYLFISHDLSIVRHISDWVIVLYLGKVMESASVEELFNNPKHPYTQSLLSAIPKNHPQEKKARIILKGEIPSPLNPPSGCPFRTRCPYAQPICAIEVPKKVMPEKNCDGNERYYNCILD